MLLASAGLLTGRTATTNRNTQREPAASGVTVLPDRVVDDGNLLTAGALSAGLDLALWIIEREVDAGTAQRVANAMEYRLIATSIEP